MGCGEGSTEVGRARDQGGSRSRRLMAKHPGGSISWVVVIFDNLGEVGAAFWTREAVFVSIPLVGALVAKHHVAMPGPRVS